MGGISCRKSGGGRLRRSLYSPDWRAPYRRRRRRACACSGRSCRRPVRIVAEAPRGTEEQRRPDPWSWGNSGPHRFHPVCRPSCRIWRLGVGSRPSLRRAPVKPVRDEPFVAGAISRRLTVLGSTGSIGLSTLDVVAYARERYGDRAFPIESLTAQSNIEVLADQVRRFRPRFAALADAARFDELKAALEGEKVELGAGPEAILEAAGRPSDVVMVAIVGAAAVE